MCHGRGNVNSIKLFQKHAEYSGGNNWQSLILQVVQLKKGTFVIHHRYTSTVRDRI